jgi:hypothetical protein
MKTKEEKRIIRAKNKASKIKRRAYLNAWNKKYKTSNPEKTKASAAKHYQANKEKYQAIKAAYAKANPGKVNAISAKRRAAKLQATPPWLTKEQLKEIEWFYTTAQELQWLSEEPLEVDHIEPLQGKISCGLHVPWNLQIIPKSDNCSKGNKV